MKKLAMALGALTAVAAMGASAQDNSDRNYPYDPEWAEQRNQWLSERHYYNEGWRGAPRAYEPRWRDDRMHDPRLRDDRFVQRYRPDGRDWECWNPRAGHFESVREGERQDDLDFARCRANVDWPRYRW